VRTFVVGGANNVPQGQIGGGPGITGTSSWVNGSDSCDTTGAMTTSVASFGAVSPTAVVGTPLATTPPASLLCIGDSIPSGQGDSGGGGALTPYSWFTRWVNNQVSAQRICTYGDLVSNWATPGACARRVPLLASFTHAVIHMGINDLSVPNTLTQLQASYTTLVQLLQAFGIKVSAATLLPRMASGNNWTTTGGQTPTSYESVRVAMNTWLRSKPIGIVNVYDLADVCETARNSGLWNVNGTANYYTIDGTYPSVAAHTAMAAALPAVTGVLV
jgi:lysophospholipase L1-like esterase